MTFPQNTPSIDQLINLPAGEIAQLPVELLAALQREIDAAAKQMKAVTARFSTALEVRYAARAAEARRACGMGVASGLSGFHSAQCEGLVKEHIDIACKKENPRNLTQGVNRSRGRKLWSPRIRTQVPVFRQRC